MKRWLWTFGNNTIFSKKYVIVYCENGDGRELIFDVYGRDNTDMSYLLEVDLYREEKLKDKGYKKMAEWAISKDLITVNLNYKTKTDYESLTSYSRILTDEFKHKIWDKMIGGI